MRPSHSLQSAQRIFGHSAENAMGASITILIPERFRKNFMMKWGRAEGPESGSGFNKPIEGRGLRKDGTEMPMEMAISSYTMKNQRYFTSIIRDRSEWKPLIRKEEAGPGHFYYGSDLNHVNDV